LSRTIGEIEKSALEKIVAAIGEFKGKTRIDLRVYYQPVAHKPDEWVPTKKGINLDPETWYDFKNLIAKVDQALTKKA